MATPESQFNSDLLTTGNSSFGGIPADGTFENAVERGFSNTKASFGASSEWLGARIGAETLEDWGEDYASRMMVEAALNPAELHSYEDIDSLGDVGTYIQEKVGENVSILASLAAGAGVGGVGTAAMRAAAGKALLKKAASDQAKKRIKRKFFSKGGARTGAHSAVFPQLAGESVEELKEAGVDLSETNTPLVVGMINTALEALPMEGLLRFSFGGLNPKMAGDVVRQSVDTLNKTGALRNIAGALRNIAGKAGKGAALGFPLEGVTELSQELVNMSARAFHDPTFDISSPESIQRLEEAFVAGATVGGSLGGGLGSLGGAANEILKKRAPRPANAEALDLADLPEQPADQSTAVPDSPENVAGQFEAVLDPESSRDSVLLTPGEEAPFSNEQAVEQGFEHIDLGEQGSLFTTNRRKAELARGKGADLTETDLNQILFNNAGVTNKAQSTEAAVARDENDRIVAAIGFNEETADSALEEAQSQAPRGTVTRESVLDVVSDRSESAQARAGQTETPREAQGELTPDEDAEAAELLGGSPDAFVQSGQEQLVEYERPRREGETRGTMQKIRLSVGRVAQALDGADPAPPQQRDAFGLDEGQVEANEAQPGVFAPELREEGRRFAVPEAVESKTEFDLDREREQPDGTRSRKELPRILGVRAKGALPEQGFRSAEIHDGVVKALFKAAAEGEAKGLEGSRIEMDAPSGQTQRFNVPELVTVGHLISGQAGTVQELESGERADAAIAAVSFLNELGFGTRENTIQQLRDGVVAPQASETEGKQGGNTVDQDRKARADRQFGEGNTRFDMGYRTQNKLNDEDAFVGALDPVEDHEGELTGADRDTNDSNLESEDTQARRAAREAYQPNRDGGADPLDSQRDSVVEGAGATDGNAHTRSTQEAAPQNITIDYDTLRLAIERLKQTGGETSTETRGRVQSLINDWSRKLGMTAPKVVISEFPGSNFAQYDPATGQIHVRPQLGQILEDTTQGNVQDVTATIAMEVLAHELGHAVQHNMYEAAPQAVKDRLHADHRAFEARTNQFDESDAASRRAERAPGAIREANIARRGRPSSAKDVGYDTSFNEWFADNIARTILGEETTADTPSVQRLFERVAERVKRVYELIRDTAGFAPAPSVQEFVDNLRQQVKHKNESGEQQTPDKRAQLEKEAKGINEILESIGFKGNAQLTDLGGIANLRGRYTAALEEADRRLQVAKHQTQEVNDNLRRQRDLAKRNLDMLDALENDQPLARVMFLRDNKGVARPTIYISDQLTGKVRDKALLHETGHVVLRQFMSNLSKTKREEIERAFGARTDYETFEENFANGFLSWSSARAEFGKLEGDSVDAKVQRSIRESFESLWKAMRTMWQKFRQKFSTDTTFTDFMEQIVNRKRIVEGETPVQPTTEHGRAVAKALAAEGFAGTGGFINPDLFPTEYLDMSVSAGAPGTARRAYVNKATQVMRQGREASKALGDFMGQMHNRWTRPLESVWRNVLKISEVADALRRQPWRGNSTSSRGDIYAEQRHVLGQWERRIHKIVTDHTVKDPSAGNLWGRLPGFGNSRPTPEMQEAMAELESNEAETSDLAKELRSIFNEIRDWQLSQGVYVPKRQNYVPRSANMDALQRQGGYTEFKNRVMAWAQTQEALEFWSDTYGEMLTEQRAEKYADALFNMFTTGEATLDETGQTTKKAQQKAARQANLSEVDAEAERHAKVLDFTSPGFHNHKQRLMSETLWNELKKPWESELGDVYENGFQQDNVAQLLVNYSKAAVKRGVWQRRFGVDSEIGQGIHGQSRKVLDDMIDAREQATSRAEINAAEERIKKFRGKFTKKWGIDPLDPSAGLKLRLNQDVKRGKITAADQEYAASTLIPQMQGVLNADFSIAGKPRAWARRGQAAMLVYQNTRVLALAPFAQAIDWALIYNRIPSEAEVERDGEIVNARSDFRATFIKSLLNKATRQELFEVGEVLGAVQNDTTETVLNDEAGAIMGSRKMAQANEAFFRITGMQFLTNYQRAMASHSALRMVEQWANTGNAEELGRFNISVDQAKAWVAAGKPKHFTEEHHSVLAGVHQFIDEGSLRPTPGMKPRAGNDNRLALLWHLNSFIYVYQQQIHGRVWAQMQEKWGETEGLERMQAAMPAITLAAHVLPLTAVAMQIRWLIDPPEDENRPQDGWDWLWQSVERSGMLGVTEILPNALTAEQYGKFGLLSPMGPTVGQMVDLGTDSFSNVLSKGYPFQQVVNGIGDRFD